MNFFTCTGMKWGNTCPPIVCTGVCTRGGVGDGRGPAGMKTFFGVNSFAPGLNVNSLASGLSCCDFFAESPVEPEVGVDMSPPLPAVGVEFGGIP